MSSQSKQTFLRQSILERGYDPMKFMEYWQQLQIQLDNIQMYQLRQIVEQFMTKQQQQILDNNDQFAQYQQAGNSSKQIYANFNWDLLTVQNTTNSNHKKQNHNNNNKKIQLNDNINSKEQDYLLSSENFKSNDKSEQKKLQNNTKQILYEQISRIISIQQVMNDSKLTKIQCLKLQQSILQHHRNVQIFVSISDVEINSQNNNISMMSKLWKNFDTTFNISTIGRNNKKSNIGVSWQVKRKYSDFQWLRETLIKIYPGIVVPPLGPQVKSQSYSLKLQNFLLDSYRCAELRNSKYFQIFLSYTNYQTFTELKQKCQQINKPKNLSSLLNISGQIQIIDSNTTIDQYSKGLKLYLSKSSQHLKKYLIFKNLLFYSVKYIITEIKNSYENISNKYQNLVNIFTQMSDQSCAFSQQKCYSKLTQTYKQIANMITKHVEINQKQKLFNEIQLLSYFQYEKDWLDNIQQLITKRSYFTQQLHRKNNQPIQKGMLSKLGGMVSIFGKVQETVDVPSNQLPVLRKQVGFFNSQLMKESIRCIEVMIQSHILHFSAYGHSRIDNVDNIQQIWSQLLVNFSKLAINS